MKHFDELHLRDRNTEFVLLRGGQRVPLWNQNFLGRWLFRRHDLDIRVPLLTGWYGSKLVTHNLVTNTGHAAANGRMSNLGSFSPFVNLAIGIGTTAAAAGDTALQSEIVSGGGQRGAATATQVTTTITNDTTQLVKTWTFSATFAVTEEGILDNAASGGTLLARQVFAAINVVSLDTLQITHKYST